MAFDDASIPTSPVAHIRELVRFLTRGRVVALCGAGCSTESGIPDYRGPEGRMRKRRPMSFQQFMGKAEARARYWSRSMVGWSRVSAAHPNAGHVALARLEHAGAVIGLITQNVDGLHHAAGSLNVLELHGSLARVRCTRCGRVELREALQRRLNHLNPDFAPSAGGAAPDGDSELPARSERGFRVPPCLSCGGILKPDVVFFGENVPKERLARSWELYGRAEGLLVLGSSLEVFSGRRFVLRAIEDDVPIAIVNLGPTRADAAAAIRIEGRLGVVLPRLAEELGAVVER